MLFLCNYLEAISAGSAGPIQSPRSSREPKVRSLPNACARAQINLDINFIVA